MNTCATVCSGAACTLLPKSTEHVDYPSALPEWTTQVYYPSVVPHGTTQACMYSSQNEAIVSVCFSTVASHPVQ